MKDMEQTGSKDKPWTKQELTVFSNGTIALAKAVVRQWILDGKPKSDEKAIKYWEELIKQYED